MDEIRIAFDAEKRREYRRALWMIHLVFAFVAVLFDVGALSKGVHGAGLWTAPAMTAVMWLATVFWALNLMFGATLLTPAGVKLRSFTTRRTIFWCDVRAIEADMRSGRGGSWWTIQVHPSHGRPRTVPGVRTTRRYDPVFVESLSTMRSYWAQAGGRKLTELPSIHD